MAIVVSTDGKLNLPPDYVDADWLCELLGLETGEAGAIGPDAYTKLRAFEQAVEDARLFGRIRRFTVRDPDSHDLLGYCFRRLDLQKILHHGA